jgi:hypothetical protein
MKNFLFLFIVCGTVLISCQKQPVASFEVNKTENISVGDTLNFHATSLHADQHEWYVEDGSILEILTGEKISYIPVYSGKLGVMLVSFSKKRKKDDEETIILDIR